MLEHAIYSVISPEGCAAILWGDASKASDAATALRMTAPELRTLNIIEEVIPEPMGGAHRDVKTMADRLSNTLDTHFLQLQQLSIATLLKQREAKFRSLGAFGPSQATPKHVKTVNS
jgi:acetyl-CoA carboxylase carboxyl transferase subunit alpha